MDSEKISEYVYDEYFKSNKKKHKKALKQAYEIRKFEIELYWKRAAYFWTFIGAAFVAYGVFYKANLDTEKQFILVVIACVGLVFSVAWHCVNKGSKFWQENWENHVELLEDQVFGPLYKTRTQRPPDRLSKWGKKLGKCGNIISADFYVAPVNFSVSKINQLVSTFMAFMWGFILLDSVGKFDTSSDFDWIKIIPIFFAAMTCWGFWKIGKSHESGHNAVTTVRKTSISFDTPRV